MDISKKVLDQWIELPRHMVDAPDRAKPPRFPAERVPAVAREIAGRLERLAAGPEDVAITSAAAGGDLLFMEACAERGVPVLVHLPFPEPRFVTASVAFAGEPWRERYFRLTRDPSVEIRVLSEELGPDPLGANSFERCNLWQLYTALSFGPSRVRFIAVWDGEPGDGPGGTKHMVDEVAERLGQVSVVGIGHVEGSKA